MNFSRRRMLVRVAITTVAFAGRVSWGSASNSRLGLVPNAPAVLLLHDGCATATALARELRASPATGRVSDTNVEMLTLKGFVRARALLDSSRGAAVLSLLDDGDSIVLEALLKHRGATNLVYRRYGAQALLSARL